MDSVILDNNTRPWDHNEKCFSLTLSSTSTTKMTDVIMLSQVNYNIAVRIEAPNSLLELPTTQSLNALPSFCNVPLQVAVYLYWRQLKNSFAKLSRFTISVFRLNVYVYIIFSSSQMNAYKGPSGISAKRGEGNRRN